MAKLNPNPKHNDNQTAPRKPRPGWHRIVVDRKAIPMQAHHVDEIARMEGRFVASGPRCECCWQKNPKPGHFCRWNITREGDGRNPDPPILWVPVYRWVRDS